MRTRAGSFLLCCCTESRAVCRRWFLRARRAILCMWTTPWKRCYRSRRCRSFRAALYITWCTGTQSTLGDVVFCTRELLGVAAEPQWSSMEQRVWDTDVWVGSPAALERDTGWRAALGLREGLASTIGWFKEHPRGFAFIARESCTPKTSLVAFVPNLCEDDLKILK
jgi:hypothetical protein